MTRALERLRPHPHRGAVIAAGAVLVGWPLLLVAIAAGGLAVGLRPLQPLPPGPGSVPAEKGPPTVPFQPGGAGE